MLQGTSLRGRIVQLFNQKSDFSHVGVIKEDRGQFWLLHADPKLGCIEEQIGKLLSRHRFIGFQLLRPTNPNSATLAVSFCESAIASGVHFNDTFRFLGGNGYYCTELVLLAYEKAGVPFLKKIKKGDVIFPEQLLDSESLKSVIFRTGERFHNQQFHHSLASSITT